MEPSARAVRQGLRESLHFSWEEGSREQKPGGPGQRTCQRIYLPDKKEPMQKQGRWRGLGQAVGEESIQYGEQLPGWGRGGQDTKLEGQTGLWTRTARELGYQSEGHGRDRYAKPQEFKDYEVSGSF